MLVGGLAAQTSTSLSVPMTVPLLLRAGSYSLGAIVDPIGVVPESDETNNAKAGNLIQIK